MNNSVKRKKKVLDKSVTIGDNEEVEESGTLRVEFNSFTANGGKSGSMSIAVVAEILSLLTDTTTPLEAAIILEGYGDSLTSPHFEKVELSNLAFRVLQETASQLGLYSIQALLEASILSSYFKVCGKDLIAASKPAAHAEYRRK